MSLYARYPKLASETRHQSPSQARAVEEIHDRVSYWPVDQLNFVYTPKDKYNIDDGMSTLEEFVKDANSIPPIGVDRRFIGDHWLKGLELRRSISPSSSKPFHTRPSWVSSNVRQTGPQSLSGIRNRDTISKDNTGGDAARIEDLLATSGKRVTGIKHQPSRWINAFAGPGGKQEFRHIYWISQSSEHRPGVLVTNTGDSCIHHPSGCEDYMLNKNLLLAKEDYNGQGGNNSFIIPNMDGSTWISPSSNPFPTVYIESGIPGQYNGVEMRTKKRKNNIRGRHRK